MKNVQKPLAMVVASVVTLPSTFMGLVVEDLAPVALFGITLLILDKTIVLTSSTLIRKIENKYVEISSLVKK